MRLSRGESRKPFICSGRWCCVMSTSSPLFCSSTSLSLFHFKNDSSLNLQNYLFVSSPWMQSIDMDTAQSRWVCLPSDCHQLLTLAFFNQKRFEVTVPDIGMFYISCRRSSQNLRKGLRSWQFSVALWCDRSSCWVWGWKDLFTWCVSKIFCQFTWHPWT